MPHLLGLDGLRGLAVIGVLLFHGGLHLGQGRLPRRLDLLHPVRVPDHQPAGPRVRHVEHHRPRPVLDPPLPPPPARRPHRDRPRGPGVVAHRQPRAARRAPGRHARRPRLHGQLALLLRRHQLRRPLRRPQPPAALLVAGDRGAVLPVLPAHRLGRHEGRRAPPAHLAARRLLGGVGRPRAVARRQHRPRLLRHRHPGRRAALRLPARRVVVGPARPAPPARHARGGSDDGRTLTAVADVARCRGAAHHVRRLGPGRPDLHQALPRRLPGLRPRHHDHHLRRHPARPGVEVPVDPVPPLGRPHLLRPVPVPLADLPVPRRGAHRAVHRARCSWCAWPSPS